MAIVPFAQTFQGQPEVGGHISQPDLDALRREAFPWSPPFDVTEDRQWRGYKLAPLPSGRLMISAAANLGASDHLGRPVLSAVGCAIDSRDLCEGPARDVGAVWRALDRFEGQLPALDALMGVIQEGSMLASDLRFEELQRRSRKFGTFMHRAIGLLSGDDPVDLVLPANEQARQHLQPILLLCPGAALLQMHLATGAVPSDRRERVQATPSRPPRSRAAVGREEQSGGIGRWVRRSKPAPEPRPSNGVVDFIDGYVSGAPAVDVGWLLDLLEMESTWPGLAARDRFRMAMRAMDAVHPSRSGAFSSIPELARLRQILDEIDTVERAIDDWRSTR